MALFLGIRRLGNQMVADILIKLKDIYFPAQNRLRKELVSKLYKFGESMNDFILVSGSKEGLQLLSHIYAKTTFDQFD